MSQVVRILLVIMMLPSLFLFAKNDKKWQVVYLATYPRCGNHWMRSLLEEATRVATSSVYRDTEPMHLKNPFPWGGYAPENGYEGNCRYPEAGEIVVVKTHYPAKPKNQFDSKSTIKNIRIVRHPVDSFYSHYVHFDKNKIPADGKIPSWYVRKSVKNWKRFEKFWNRDSNTYTVRYEDMLSNLNYYFREILAQIGYQLSEEDIERALNKYPARGGPVQHMDDYHPQDLKYINKELDELMKNYGYTI